MTPRPFDVRLRLAREASARLTEAVGQVIVGQKDVVEQTLWGLLAGGHVLLEGAPGWARRCSCAPSPRASTCASRASSSRPI
jgi:hypothetical protein